MCAQQRKLMMMANNYSPMIHETKKLKIINFLRELFGQQNFYINSKFQALRKVSNIIHNINFNLQLTIISEEILYLFVVYRIIKFLRSSCSIYSHISTILKKYTLYRGVCLQTFLNTKNNHKMVLLDLVILHQLTSIIINIITSYYTCINYEQ